MMWIHTYFVSRIWSHRLSNHKSVAMKYEDKMCVTFTINAHQWFQLILFILLSVCLCVCVQLFACLVFYLYHPLLTTSRDHFGSLKLKEVLHRVHTHTTVCVYKSTKNKRWKSHSKSNNLVGWWSPKHSINLLILIK